MNGQIAPAFVLFSAATLAAQAPVAPKSAAVQVIEQANQARTKDLTVPLVLGQGPWHGPVIGFAGPYLDLPGRPNAYAVHVPSIPAALCADFLAAGAWRFDDIWVTTTALASGSSVYTDGRFDPDKAAQKCLAADATVGATFVTDKRQGGHP